MSDHCQSAGNRLPWRSLGLAGLMVAPFATLGPAPETWLYDRDAIGRGELWRLLTGHWVHSDTAHLAWNLGALLALGWILEVRRCFLLVPGLLAGTLGVDLMLWWGLPELNQYCGMSGVLNTLLLLVMASLWQRSTAGPLAIIGLLSLAKILAELWLGQALLTHTAWASVPQAHLAGWLTGLAVLAAGWLPGFRNKRPGRSHDATFAVPLRSGNRSA